MSVFLGAQVSRRSFIRRASLTVLGGPALGLAACGDVRRSSPDGRSRSAAAAVTRPVLRPWADDMIWMDLPSEELPVAYVSMALRQVFVDYEYRDRAAWLLDAHISVSTALWRIPLPGDPEGQPITPGDELREFEELAMRQWDPSLSPAMDDIRIRRGVALPREVDFDCVPGPGGWFGAGPWTMRSVSGSLAETTREDFQVLGTGLRFGDRTCVQGREAVQLVGWAARS